MKIISMEKKENGISGVGILGKIFWQDDEEAFLLP
jgi:hypothetical protein